MEEKVVNKEAEEKQDNEQDKKKGNNSKKNNTKHGKNSKEKDNPEEFNKTKNQEIKKKKEKFIDRVTEILEISSDSTNNNDLDRKENTEKKINKLQKKNSNDPGTKKGKIIK